MKTRILHTYDAQCEKCNNGVCKHNVSKPPRGNANDSPQHTPTPWKLGRWTGEAAKKNTLIESLDHNIIATMQWQLDDKEKANAAFIVRAVNSHETLIKALKTIAKNGLCSFKCGKCSHEIAEQAIAKAEGK